MRLGFALLTLLASQAGALPAPVNAPLDGGTVRANAVVIPPSLRREREHQGSLLPDTLFLLGSPEVLAALGSFHPEESARGPSTA